ncbi:hypothetical protein EJ06DRAFT_529583 [Trichodelitschia bisporula]|uniref:Uncharacterized protein n=1 Tax=Trichodelitschia bisporula TaxID=703511 RepID=A0A6G1HZI3_9PEZI|nr:hypothetical protein EJ06DRAFT_529583 [Trichodelitschia bisporula]
MVLEDISPPPSTDDFSTTSPSSAIDFSALPKPLPLIGLLTGRTNARLKQVIEHNKANAERLMRRSMTPTEAQAFATHVASANRTTSVGSFIGLAGGVYRAYTTRATYRFPYWQPKPEQFNPDNVFGLRGQASHNLVHALRYTSYGAAGLFLGFFLTDISASARLAVNVATDERLADFRKSIEQYAKERGAQRGQTVPEAQQPAREQPREAKAWNAPRRADDSDDDMSPQARVEADSGLMDDAQARGYEGRQRARQDDDATARSTFSIDKVAQQPKGFSETYSSEGETSPQRDDGPSGSAWERIRRQAGGGGQSGSQARWQKPEATGEKQPWDSFSFEKTEEERQLAKAEAQREFNKRIERERQGKDFDEGEKRW